MEGDSARVLAVSQNACVEELRVSSGGNAC
jgi:hypothetical protein